MIIDIQDKEKYMILKISKDSRFIIADEQAITDMAAAIEKVNRSDHTVVLVQADAEGLAGADLKLFNSGDLNRVKRFLWHTTHMFNEIERSKKIFIAAIDGTVFGGGFEFTLACDFVLASKTSEFSMKEILLGIIPGADGIKRLVRCVGKRRAMDLLLTGRNLTAKEALGCGLINEVVPKRKLLARAEEFAKEVASKNPVALKLTKRLANAALEKNITKDEISAFLECLKTEYAKNAINAFLDKK
jgi:enoyl-CoA hydratase/carnithine racemase